MGVGEVSRVEARHERKQSAEVSQQVMRSLWRTWICVVSAQDYDYPCSSVMLQLTKLL